MATRHDAQGLAISTATDDAVTAWNHAMTGYLKYRADASQRIAGLLAADAEFALAHCFKGYMTMLGFKQTLVPAAAEAHAAAAKHAASATPREQAHVAALGAWVAGDLDRALATWEQILGEHPRDILAFRLHHFNAFWLGKPEVMLSAVERVLPAWSREDAAYGSILGCRAFANEECGNYTIAEGAGRAAVEIDPGDVWATHAVAHVLEMQGRRGEGIQWLTTLEPYWEGASNLVHHLWWHRGLYHLERGEHDQVLALYDKRFRNLSSPLTQAQPDLYIDVQNAASMLYRLQRLGIDVGDRWIEIADKAETRIGDCVNPFTLPHWMMALAATSRWSAAKRMIDGMRAFAGRNDGALPPLVRHYALPACTAILESARGKHADAAATLRPAVSGMYRLGGSHAQQDVLEQVFLDAAMKSGHRDDVAMMLERVSARHPVPPQRRAGYRDAARTHWH